MRWTLMVMVLTLGAAGLGACSGPDPHDRSYWTWPGGDPKDIKQYSTNPYPAPDAPPFSPGAVGHGGG